MSQVIVTDDSLKDRREESKQQEDHIDREGMFNGWRMNDITGKDMIAGIAGVLFLPILGLWALFAGLMTLVIFIFNQVMHLLGILVGGKNSLHGK